jgi:archaeosortase A (PGF-CTERM-specific)
MILLAGLILEGLGFYSQKKEKHLFRLSGWLALGIYWPTQAPNFLGVGDVTNASFCLIALPFFFYLAYHEYLSYRTGEEHRGLKFMAGAAFLAGFPYFVVDRIPIVAGSLISVVAQQSVWLFNTMTGNSFTVMPVDYYGNSLWYKTDLVHEIGALVPQANIRIILACTAIQSMLIAFGVIVAASSDWKNKIKALVMDISAIYLLNLVRNAGVIYLTYYRITDFETAHNEIGKGGSLIALIILLFITFKIMPELYDDIASLAELPKRFSRLKRSL